MADAIDEATKEKLKASLWFSIGKIVDEETLRLNTSATPQFIGSLTEMVWTQIENVAIDLQTFANHANRATVTTDDVLLITRRNEALEGIVREFVDGDKAKPKQRARVLSETNGRTKNGVLKGRVEKGKGKAK